MFDEVISGFRAAAGGAQQVFGVRPDLTCLGKIIGGGLPVGAYGGRADVMELVAPSGPVYQAGTLSGNPLAMTAGLWSSQRAVAEALSAPGEAGRGAGVGLADAARDAGVPLQVNAFGSLVTPFFTSQPVRDYQSAAGGGYRRLCGVLPRHARARRSTRRRRSSKRGSFPAAHTEKDVEKTVKAAREALKETRRAANR